MDKALFDRFYGHYPRKVGKAKARKAWEKCKGDPGVIIEDVIHRKENDRIWLGEKIYIPHPATYLNGERWDDEIDYSREKTNGTNHESPTAGYESWRDRRQATARAAKSTAFEQQP